MLILILIDVQDSQKAVFSFEKGSNRQNHSCLGFLYPVKKSPPSKISAPYRYLENPASACVNLNYDIYNKRETKSAKVAKMEEFIKTCDQHSRSLILVIFSAW